MCGVVRTISTRQRGEREPMEIERLAVSTGTLPYALGAQYHEMDALAAAVEALRHPYLEVVLHPDWRTEPEPRTVQPSAWTESTSLSFPDFAQWITRRLTTASVISIHGNRDLGSFIASGDREDWSCGRKLAEGNLQVAESVGARVFVAHAWDPQDPDPKLEIAGEILGDLGEQFPGVRITVETIPTHEGAPSQPTSLERVLGAGADLGVTLDLAWVSHHGSLEDFLPFVERVANVHVQGRIHRDERGVTLLARGSGVPLEPMMRRLLERDYPGQWTLELNGSRSLLDFAEALEHLDEIITGRERGK